MLVQQESQIGSRLMGRSNRQEHVRAVEKVTVQYTEWTTPEAVV
jgi:hypothetical protein